MNTGVTKELIFDLFAANITPLQRRLIDDWLREAGNEELYYQWLEEWENSAPEYLPQSDTLLTQYQHFLQENPVQEWPDTNGEITAPHRTATNWKKWLMAASILLVAGCSIWLFQDTLRYRTYHTNFGEIKTFTLADGSEVTLNANSVLRLTRRGFGRTNRDVYLEGEANFSVKHTADHQKFIVHTNKSFDVVVLGTEFSVFSRERASRVALSKGEVVVHYKQGETAGQLVMKPGELVSLDKKNPPVPQKITAPKTLSMWQEKRFVFDETRLFEVAAMIEESYGLKVVIRSETLAHRTLMGSFRAENVDELLQTISELLDINMLRQGKTVQLFEK
jgi:transmembrane sensor